MDFAISFVSNNIPNCCVLITGNHSVNYTPCLVGLVASVSASLTVGRGLASRLGHTKDHHKNGTNCLPA